MEEDLEEPDKGEKDADEEKEQLEKKESKLTEKQ